MNLSKTILVAPLNWGLGHATRCIPIIRALKEDGYKVIIASDGDALELLKKEFPDTITTTLPSYSIRYPKKGDKVLQKIISQGPTIYKAIKAEHRELDQLIDTYAIDGVISDNRLGLYTYKVPSVFITHQLQVLSGKTTWLSSYVHNIFIKKFDECWVPDLQGPQNLSGRLGHPKKVSTPTKYIGPLSRMQAAEEIQEYRVTAVLSGPEPQRTQLEKLLIKRLSRYKGKVLIVQGVVAKEQHFFSKEGIDMVNYLTSPQLEKALNSSEYVIARSGYTTIMDLACLGKKAFFIPTPGQPEQEYLAKLLQEKAMVPFSHQNDFKIKHLARLQIYKGFEKIAPHQELRQFFSLFEGKRELRSNSIFAFNINLLFVRFYNMLYNRKTES